MRNAYSGLFHAGLGYIDGAVQAITVGKEKFPQCGWNLLPFVSTYDRGMACSSAFPTHVDSKDAAMYKLLAPVRNSAVNRITNSLPGQNPNASLQGARTILDNAFSRLSRNAGLSQRTFVTEPTYKKLQEAIPGKIDVSMVPPYQERGACHSQAMKIMSARMDAAYQDSASCSSRPLGRIWDQLKMSVVGDLKAVKPPSSADELLARFNEKGILSLRGPGLGDNYNDHVVVIFSVSKIDVPGKGPKIVVGAIDCNDQANDPETKASRDTAAHLGKSHPSALTHDEANKNGAHLRRIRFMDGDALMKHMNESTKRCMELIAEGKMLPPEALLPRKSIPALTAEESARLSQILTEIYDTPEVEKFDDRSPEHLEQNAAAQRSKGGAMAQRLYKEVAMNDSEQG